MSEIKFRAWDKRCGEMWVPIIDKDGVPCAKDPISGQLVRMDGDLLDPVMQYTGLKDKNGKEIYEGDILKYSRKDGLRSNQVGRLFLHFVEDIRHPFDNAHLFEVIGNIYENPELLEE